MVKRFLFSLNNRKQFSILYFESNVSKIKNMANQAHKVSLKNICLFCFLKSGGKDPTNKTINIIWFFLKKEKQTINNTRKQKTYIYYSNWTNLA